MERHYFYGGYYMAKGANQKLKLLYIIKFLYELSDEQHPISTSLLIEELARVGIGAERKSIYDDINQLIDFGFDININHSKTKGGYYIGERQFEISELKLLVDSVLASRFISLKKSRALIEKLEQTASVNDRAVLKRNVYVRNRVKTDNDSIYYAINDIYTAMSENKKISFLYMEWNIDKSKKPRKEGKRYIISPYALTIKDENYYLIAYDDAANMIKHYRVDKIKDVAFEDENRSGNDIFRKFDVAGYTDKTFGMFSGEDEIVTLRFKESLCGVIFDRFGTDISVRKDSDGFALARVSVNVSNQFFGWVSSLGNDVQITAPSSVREDYISFLQNAMNNYK